LLCSSDFQVLPHFTFPKIVDEHDMCALFKTA
jgi:hypothetical protein